MKCLDAAQELVGGSGLSYKVELLNSVCIEQDHLQGKPCDKLLPKQHPRLHPNHRLRNVLVKSKLSAGAHAATEL